MTKELICIVCPRGCSLTVELDGEEVQRITGNACPRGADYAVSECLHPVRTLTTTVRAENGAMVPVKTDAPVPKERLLELIDVTKRVKAVLPVRMGDILIKDIAGIKGVNLVATKPVLQ